MFRLRNAITGLEHAFEERWQAIEFWAEQKYAKIWEHTPSLGDAPTKVKADAPSDEPAVVAEPVLADEPAAVQASTPAHPVNAAIYTPTADQTPAPDLP